MKYKLTDNKKTVNGVAVYQIEALKDFGDVKKGDLGGWIESEANLSQKGNCWVGGNAKVYGTARVYRNAQACGDAKVFGDARVFGNAKVYGNAEVSGDARVFEDAKGYGFAQVFGDARVFEDAMVSGNAKVFEDAVVCGNAEVYGFAQVYGNANVHENAVISEYQTVSDCYCITDLSKNMKESIRCQTGLGVFNNEVIVYKQVLKSLRSFHDKKFVYKVGEIVETEKPEISNESCASGLHGSNMNYWNNMENIESSTFLAIKVQLEDVITVQQGKIRFKKGLVLGTYDIEK